MRHEAQKTKAAYQQKTTPEMFAVGGKKPGIFRPGVKAGGVADGFPYPLAEHYP